MGKHDQSSSLKLIESSMRSCVFPVNKNDQQELTWREKSHQEENNLTRSKIISPGGKINSPGGKNLTRREIISPVLLPMLVTRGNKSTL